MELLGFYDEPYRVHTEPVRKPRRVVAPAAQPSRRHHSSPADLVADLWETTQLDASALEWWKPGVIARRKLAGGRMRTATVVGLVLAAALALLLGWMALSRPAQINAEAVVAFRQAVDEATPTLQPLADLARSLGADSPPDIVEASTAVLTAESASRGFFSAAGSLRGDELAPVRESAVATAGNVLDSTSQLSRLLAFRLATGQALIVPDIPTDPAALDIGVVTERIAQWRADIEATMADVPEGVLGDVQTEIARWQADQQAWQEQYLDAYREGDATAVTAAFEEQTRAVSQLRTQMLAGLNAAGDKIAATIESAARTITRYSVGG